MRQPYHRGFWMNFKGLVIWSLLGAFILCLAPLTALAGTDVGQPYNLMPQAGTYIAPQLFFEPFLGAPAPAAAYGPYTSGFVYSAQKSAAFGPFAPPVAEASEQFYQLPGLTPFGPYPGAGYALAGGVGFDPVTGYYGPYGAYMPL
jgi:hypothetical protein